MTKNEKFLDGCHKYGWIITIVMNLALFAYFLGGISVKVDDLQHRASRIESQLDGLMQRMVKP